MLRTLSGHGRRSRCMHGMAATAAMFMATSAWAQPQIISLGSGSPNSVTPDLAGTRVVGGAGISAAAAGRWTLTGAALSATNIAGTTGGEVLSFGAGTSITQVVAAINAVSDATGVAATNNAGTLELDSTAYGSASFVSVNVLSGDTNGTFAGGLRSARRTSPRRSAKTSLDAPPEMNVAVSGSPLPGSFCASIQRASASVSMTGAGLASLSALC